MVKHTLKILQYSQRKIFTQQAMKCLKLTIKTLEQSVKYVQS